MDLFDRSITVVFPDAYTKTNELQSIGITYPFIIAKLNESDAQSRMGNVNTLFNLCDGACEATQIVSHEMRIIKHVNGCLMRPEAWWMSLSTLDAIPLKNAFIASMLQPLTDLSPVHIPTVPDTIWSHLFYQHYSTPTVGADNYLKRLSPLLDTANTTPSMLNVIERVPPVIRVSRNALYNELATFI